MAKNQNIKQKHYCNTINKDLKKCVTCSVVSDSLWFYGLWSSRLLCPENSSDKNTGVGCYFFLLGVFQTQSWNPGPLRCRQIILSELTGKDLKKWSTSKKKKILKNLPKYQSFSILVIPYICMHIWVCVCVYIYIYKTAWFTTQMCRKNKSLRLKEWPSYVDVLHA